MPPLVRGSPSNLVQHSRQLHYDQWVTLLVAAYTWTILYFQFFFWTSSFFPKFKWKKESYFSVSFFPFNFLSYKFSFYLFFSKFIFFMLRLGWQSGVQNSPHAIIPGIRASLNEDHLASPPEVVPKWNDQFDLFNCLHRNIALTFQEIRDWPVNNVHMSTLCNQMLESLV